jgi:purine-binding chemotaxis protein CheW
VQEIIKFLLGNEYFAVEASKIREIVIAPQITELPNSEEWVKGVINLRGDVVPVIDFRIKFKTSSTAAYDARSVVMAVKTNDDRMIGVIVDEVKDMEEIDFEDLTQSPEIGTSIESKYIKGLLKKDNEMVVMMDFERVLDRVDIESSS